MRFVLCRCYPICLDQEKLDELEHVEERTWILSDGGVYLKMIAILKKTGSEILRIQI